MRSARKLVGAVAAAWVDDHCSRKAAALAYYTAFSVAPVLVVVLWVVALVVDSAVAAGEIRSQAQTLLGPSGAALLDELLEHTSQSEERGIAAAIAGVALLVGATTAFAELKDSLDEIWRIERAAPQGVLGWVRTRVLSFGLVLVIAFLLLVSLAVNAGVSGLFHYVSRTVGIDAAILVQTGATLTTALVVAGVFAAIYKLLPAVQLRWRDVARSALVTTLLFMCGQLGIGAYLGNWAPASAFGAAGSLALLLLWIYYSTAVFFLGAELIRFWVEPVRLVADGAPPPSCNPASAHAPEPPSARVSS